MQTVREIISSIKIPVREASADSILTNLYVYSHFKSNLEAVMSRDSEQYKTSGRDSLVQTIPCVELVEAPTIDPCCGIRSKCTVYRTKEKLPALLEDSEGVRITLVAPVDHLYKTSGTDNSLTLIKPADFIRRLENPWAKMNPEKYVIYSEGHLYFPTVRWKKVLIQGIFLEDISQYKCDCESSEDKECVRFLDTKVYATERQINEAKNKTILELIQTYKQIRPQLVIDKNETT